MDHSMDLRRAIRDRDEAYKAGDYAGYLACYAPDISVCFAGHRMTADEVRAYVSQAFESGGRSLDVRIGDPEHMQFSAAGDAANVSFVWRERFRYADGREVDNEYFETDVWYRRNGEWKIAYIHLSIIKEHPATG